MPMKPSEVATLLSQIAAADPLHNTQSQEKFATKTDTWHGILKDLDFDTCVRVVQLYYLDPNSKSITPGILASRAAALAPAAPRPMSGAPDDVARRERACGSPACRCTHLECFNGFLDKEVEIERNNRKYTAVVRCQVCKAALEARTGVAVS